MEDSSIEYLEQFIGKKWLESEFKKVNTKSPTKGTGVPFVSYHPWVHYMYEIEYSMRRAQIKGQDSAILGPYYFLLDYAGMLLKDNINYIIDKLDAQKRLRNSNQFYDLIWELETRSMMTKLGAEVLFVDPNSGRTNDGLVTLDKHTIDFECKNKILENDMYKTNGVFAHVLVERLGDVESIQNKIIQVECLSARLEDIKEIVHTIRTKLDVSDYVSILGKYRVRVLTKLPFSTPVQNLINRDAVYQVFIIKEVKKEDFYKTNSPSEAVKAKVLFKMPEPLYELRNLDTVLKKANSQLLNGGVVFLQVPYTTFENARVTVGKLLEQSFSHILGVKIAAIDINFALPKGVALRSLEEFVLSPTGTKTLSQQEIAFFTSKMAFSHLIPLNSNSEYK
jgi:hypothetical protein